MILISGRVSETTTMECSRCVDSRWRLLVLVPYRRFAEPDGPRDRTADLALRSLRRVCVCEQSRYSSNNQSARVCPSDLEIFSAATILFYYYYYDFFLFRRPNRKKKLALGRYCLLYTRQVFTTSLPPSYSLRMYVRTLTRTHCTIGRRQIQGR